MIYFRYSNNKVISIYSSYDLASSKGITLTRSLRELYFSKKKNIQYLNKSHLNQNMKNKIQLQLSHFIKTLAAKGEEFKKLILRVFKI